MGFYRGPLEVTLYKDILGFHDYLWVYKRVRALQRAVGVCSTALRHVVVKQFSRFRV